MSGFGVLGFRICGFWGLGDKGFGLQVLGYPKQPSPE